MNFVSKEILKEQFFSKMAAGSPIMVPGSKSARVVSTVFGSAYSKITGSEADHRLMSTSRSLSKVGAISLSGKYESGFDVPLSGKAPIRERIARGVFTSNTLPSDWADLFDAIRLDITIRTLANPTVRQLFYDVMDMPNASQLVKATDLFPYAFEFTKNNGEGQSVKQGVKRQGQYEPIEMFIYSAGFTWTLLAELFDQTYDSTRMNDGIAQAYAAKRDDLAIAPIQAYSYGSAGTTKHTAASTEGDSRQEKLWNTLLDAVDDLGVRVDPVTKRRIDTTGLALLTSTFDANHVAYIQGNGGLPSDRNRKYTTIPNISNIVAYDGDVIEFPDKTLTYAGIPAGTAFLIKPNRYMKVAVKRGLQMEMDATPNVETLAREQRAWYFSEGLFSYGIGTHIQKITLPTW